MVSERGESHEALKWFMRNYDKALEYFSRKADDRRGRSSYREISKMAASGHERSFDWLKKKAAVGDEKAQCRLGRLYEGETMKVYLDDNST